MNDLFPDASTVNDDIRLSKTFPYTAMIWEEKESGCYTAWLL